MTNLEHWNNYTSGLSSPQSYLDWCWRYTISAALQRRVWAGPPNQPVYPNMYIILVGEPGIGKGLPIREVSNILRHWKLSDAKSNTDKLDKQQQDVAKTVIEGDLHKAQDAELQAKSKGADVVPAGLIPLAADATTYEALVKAVSEGYRRINYVDENGKLKIYGHSSMAFALQELGSLMRKRTDDTVNYLLGLYDCPVDYEYITLTRGKDRVRKGCINLLAGTTPTFMQSTFDEKLMGEGFSSRTFYIFASKNRKNTFFLPTLNESQKESYNVLVNHIRDLTSLYGNVTVEQSTFDWLAKWWDDTENRKHDRVNRSVKLIPYYARKNIHVMKVAMALHFSDSLEMRIPLETFQRAIKILEEEEKNMHFAITVGSDNHLAKVANKVIEMLSSGPKCFVELYTKCFSIADRKQLEETLAFLTDTEQVTVFTETVGETEETRQYWRIKE